MRCPCCGKGMEEKNKTIPENQRSILYDKILICKVCLLEGNEIQLKLPGPRAILAKEHVIKLRAIKANGEEATTALEAIIAFNGNAGQEK